MITRVRLENWRAYRQLDLSLEGGTTFVVARNGVGKTSLVQGAAWALFGERLGIDPRGAIRSGAEAAHSSVDLVLPDGRKLSVSRSITRNGSRPTTTAILDGQKLRSETELDATLGQALGANPAYLARLCLITEGALHSSAQEAFNLHQHLSQVFGVEDLLAAAESTGSVEKEARRQTAKLRQARATDDAELASRRHQRDQLDARLAALEDERQQVHTAAVAADADYAHAERWVAFRAARQAWKAAVGELASTAQPVLTPSSALSERLVGPESELDPEELAAMLAAVLGEAESHAQHELDTLHRATTELELRRQAVERALAQLEAADEAACPVCLRPMTAHEARHAADHHRAEIDQLASELADQRAHEAHEAASRRLGAIRASRRRLATLPRPEPPTISAAGRDSAGGSEADVDVEGIRVRLDECRSRLQTLSSSIAETRRARELLAHELAQEEAARAARREVEHAFRREAMATALHSTLRTTAAEIVSRRIDPLAREVAGRWKRVFGERGSLQLRGDGSLVISRDGYEIPFFDFSGGEKVVAVLLTRVLVLTASTRARFLWLDEPLEHLDPRNRRIVASMLVRASDQEHLDQVFVTTYEESIARRLADQVPNARLVYVRAEEG